GGRNLAQERIFDRTQNEGKWSAQLVADIAEESSLRSIQVGQFFGALSFCFIRLSIGDAGGNLSRCQIEISLVVRIELTIGIQCGDKHTGGLLLSAPENGHHPSLVWRFIPDSGGQIRK